MDLLLNVALCMSVNLKTRKRDAQLYRFLLSNLGMGIKTTETLTPNEI